MANSEGAAFVEKFKPPMSTVAMWLAVVALPLLLSLLTPYPFLLGLLATLLTGFIGLLMSIIRLVVTKEHVHIQYGPIGPKIPISDIVSAKTIQYSFFESGGWGIRKSLKRRRTWVYNMLGDGRNAVEIQWRKNGKIHTTIVSSRHGAQVVAAIEKQQEGLSTNLQDAREKVGLLDAPAARQAVPDGRQAVRAEHVSVNSTETDS